MYSLTKNLDKVYFNFTNPQTVCIIRCCDKGGFTPVHFLVFLFPELVLQLFLDKIGYPLTCLRVATNSKKVPIVGNCSCMRVSCHFFSKVAQKSQKPMQCTSLPHFPDGFCIANAPAGLFPYGWACPALDAGKRGRAGRVNEERRNEI